MPREPRETLDRQGVLAGKICLVTGGAGFIGSHIVELLLDAGAAEVRVIDNMVRGRRDNLARALTSNRVRLIEGDIRDTETMKSLVAGCDTVFHQAALRITHCAQEPRAAFEVMVAATYDLVELCLEANIRKLVAASTASVYGMADQFPTTEAQHPYNNRTLYGAAKAFNEGLYRSFNDMHGLNYVTLRYFNVYGPRMDIHGKYTEVLVRWMERLARGKPPIIFGDGLQTLDMVDVRDVARANILSAVSDVSDVALNVGSGTETSLLELARLLCRVMHQPDLTPLHRETRAVNAVSKRLADVSKARELIGFEVAHPLEKGMTELVAWWRSETALAGVAA